MAAALDSAADSAATPLHAATTEVDSADSAPPLGLLAVDLLAALVAGSVAEGSAAAEALVAEAFMAAVAALVEADTAKLDAILSRSSYSLLTRRL